jgi:nitroimidazol reductase NimA-like FMN-containing flavoprotein (pyridoxamine 5'-phosphate oxidase superfamily)
MDRRTCLMLLGTRQVGRIALSGEEPFVVPVNFIVVDDLVVFRSDPSSHAARSVGTAVVFEVDAVDIGHEAGWSVLVRGLLQDITGRLQDEPDAQRLHTWAPGDKSRWLAIHLGNVTGRWVEGPTRPRSRHDDRGYL